MEELDISRVCPCPGSKASRAAAGRPDALNSEFLYYSSTLKIVAPALTSDVDRQKIIPWVRKLFSPAYHSSQFREKRNRYLLYLTITLLNDEAHGIFIQEVPDGALPDINAIEHEPIPAAEWELDKMWHETLLGLPEDFQNLECSVHGHQDQCKRDHALDIILDQEFQFMLYMARPYASLLHNVDDRTKIATWLQTLCTIHEDSCSSMRGIRNDYMMSLLGYIHELRVVGPFAEYPPWKTLPPLAEAAKTAAELRPVTDPSCPEANEFLSAQTIPSDGAFCYIAITGDLVSSNAGPA